MLSRPTLGREPNGLRNFSPGARINTFCARWLRAGGSIVVTRMQTHAALVSFRRAVSRSVYPGTRPQTIIGGGRRQLPTQTRLTANQEALRARYYSRCSMAYRAFDPLLSRR